MEQQFYVKLVKLVTHRSQESDGDELFIKYKGRRIWPEEKKYFDVGIKKIDVPVEAKIKISNFGWVIFELWEYDNWLSSSRLGTFRMFIDEDTNMGEQYECTISNEKGEFVNYSLHWAIEKRIVWQT